MKKFARIIDFGEDQQCVCMLGISEDGYPSVILYFYYEDLDIYIHCNLFCHPKNENEEVDMEKIRKLRDQVFESMDAIKTLIIYNDTYKKIKENQDETLQ